MRLSFVLQTQRVTAAQLSLMVLAVGVQLQRDVAPAWGLAPPELDTHLYRNVAETPMGSYPLVLLDDSDEERALGYHDEGADDRPFARVFCAGLTVAEVSTTLSHEACELLVDPLCNTYDRGSDGRRYAREVCDPVEDQTYVVNGVVVSNFVYPAWSDATPKRGKKLDHLGRLRRPLQVSAGGYVIVEGADGQDSVEPTTMAAKKLGRLSRTKRRVYSFPAVT